MSADRAAVGEVLLAEIIEGEGDKRKITAKTLRAGLKELGKDAEFADERKALEDYAALHLIKWGPVWK